MTRASAAARSISSRRRVRWLLPRLVLQLLAVLVLCELGIRLLEVISPGVRTLLYSPSEARRIEAAASLPELMDESILGFVPRRLRVGFVLNSRSFRTEEYVGRPPSPDRPRVVVLGDSFVFDSGGVPYSQMWFEVMERRLAHMGRPVDVLGVGVPGVGPRFLRRLFQLEADQLDPSVVVLSFFVGNDFTDERRHGLKSRGAAAMFDASATLRLLRNVGRAGGHGALSPVHDRPLPRGGYSLEAGEITRLEMTAQEHLRVESLRALIYLERRRSWFEGLARDAAEVVAGLAHDTEAGGAELFVVLVPDELQIDSALRQAVLRDLGVTPDELDLDAPQRYFTALLAARGVPVLDVLPSFRQHQQGSLFWPRNTHLNVDGNQLLGDAVARFLAARLSAAATRGDEGH